MAVIGKIRERGGLLVFIVGGALVLFVVGEVITGSTGLDRGDRSVGEVAGEPVGIMEFSNRVDMQEANYRQQGQTVDNQMRDQIRNAVWNEIVRERTLLVQAEEAGIGRSISIDELDDIRFGNNIAPMFRNDQSIMDPATGRPDPARLRQGLKNLQDNNPGAFSELNRSLATNRVYEKYNTLLRKSVFTNSAQVADEHAVKNTRATFSVVSRSFQSVPDSTYAVTDSEVRRFYDAHKAERRFRQVDGRAFAYVSFPATATSKDVEDAYNELARAKQELEASPDARTDSSLVLAYSESRNPTATPYEEGTADRRNDSLIVHGQPGSVVGPFREGNVWKMVKVIGLVDVPEARVRHILLSSSSEDPTVKQRADSLLAVVKRDRSKFDELVEKFSEDPGSKSTGGVYEWFGRERMVPEFTKASFDERTGAITIAKTSYGYHIVEVLGQRNRSERRVLTLDRTIEPREGMSEAWRFANTFSLNNRDTARFRTAAEEQGIPYTPVNELRADQRFVPGLQQPAEMISWVNRAAEVGNTSEPIANGDVYVVGILHGVRKAGVPRLDDARARFTAEALKQKKAEALLAAFAGKTDLEELAKEQGVSVQQATDLAFSASALPGGQNDPASVGGAFATEVGSLSAPFKGEQGVYVVRMASMTPADALPEGSNERRVVTDRLRNRAESQAFNALKEAATIKDDRSRFF